MSKTFIEILKSEDVEKFNPYHDRLGRFATGGGFGMSSSVYTGDPSRQAVTFSANPRTVAGANAIERHGGVVPTAYGWNDGKPGSETKRPEPEKKPEKQPEKPKENGKPQTADEASAYAQKNLQFKDVNYNGMDAETANHVNDTIAKIHAKYPELAGTVNSIEQTNRRGVEASMGVSSRFGPDGIPSQTLSLGARYRQGMAEVERAHKESKSTGWSPPNTTADSIIWHEYGHAWANLQRAKISAQKEPDSQYYRSMDYHSSHKSASLEKDWIRDAAKATKQTQKAFKEKISRYATTNAHETWAEAFSEYHTSSNPRPECVALMRAAGIN